MGVPLHLRLCFFTARFRYAAALMRILGSMSYMIGALPKKWLKFKCKESLAGIESKSYRAIFKV